MTTIIPIIEKSFIDSKEEEYAGKKKTSFWASESELMAFDIFHRWKGTPPTNPMGGETLLMLKMRKLPEEAVVAMVRKSGHLIEKYSNDERVYFEWGPNKVPVSGYPDLGFYMNKEKQDKPVIVEIKTYYGHMQHYQVTNGNPRVSYLKQLAIYLYHFKVPNGILLMINQGTGEATEFELTVNPDNPYHFYCQDNAVEINLEDVFKRWEKIYIENILTGVEPAIEAQYKYDIDKINWAATSKSAIQKARANKAVIGDWGVKYSDFKDLILVRQNTAPGYTDQELEKIKKLTDGYTVKKAATVRFDPLSL